MGEFDDLFGIGRNENYRMFRIIIQMVIFFILSNPAQPVLPLAWLFLRFENIPE